MRDASDALLSDHFQTPSSSVTYALHSGTDWKSLLGTLLIILAPCGIFFGFVAPKVGRNVSWALVAVVAVELVLAMVFLALTALRDPGFFPRDDPNRPEAKT